MFRRRLKGKAMKLESTGVRSSSMDGEAVVKISYIIGRLLGEFAKGIFLGLGFSVGMIIVVRVLENQ